MQTFTTSLRVMYSNNSNASYPGMSKMTKVDKSNSVSLLKYIKIQQGQYIKFIIYADCNTVSLILSYKQNKDYKMLADCQEEKVVEFNIYHCKKLHNAEWI